MIKLLSLRERLGFFDRLTQSILVRLRQVVEKYEKNQEEQQWWSVLSHIL